ncbi:NucA/NucB deoxyribonuclease domain-containing protein [Paenibacillus sp. N3.4]|uniref:NucA/NucB deoxyribonuclease domain-containing protein n=1 Tax=Paenibacillus sp. N3.4 TaxID=2603222 RepID=UPI0011C7682B|nr:NucA/NucB deoxyribonuclease domain-containing protein [Paenibacillus sp. N3.4]TXK85808.1 DNA-entry nuclease [Paenibacillus sp. N3.4]
MNKKITYVLLFILLFSILYYNKDPFLAVLRNVNGQPTVTLSVPSERFPETAAHIKSAIRHGEPDICTIDRKGAEENRKHSLKGVPTKKGFDRDEFPMAMCAEGGQGADIEYISPSDNRGAGSWIANQLEKYKDGTKVKIVVE